MNKIKVFVLLISFNTIIETHATGFLHRNLVSPYNIVDGNNNPVVLRGANLGNWMVFEGYLFDHNGNGNFDSHTEVMNSITSMVGAANYSTFLDAWMNNFVTKADIINLKNEGFNHVRLPIHYKQFYNGSTYTASGFRYIDSLLNWCSASQVYVILDLHCAPGSQNGDYHSDAANGQGADLWNGYPSGTNDDITIGVWGYIANYYKNHPWVGGYDILNEPKNYTNWMLRDLYVRITNQIRSVDTNHIIFAESDQSGWAYSDLSPMNWDNNLCLSFHNYWTGIPSSPQIEDQMAFAASEKVPVWFGEFGENSNHWYNAQRRDLESRGAGWAVWVHKKVNSVTGLYAPQRPGASYNNITNYWNCGGCGTMPTNQLTTFLNLASNCNISNAKKNKDVFDALIRSDYHTTPKPFVNHNLPCIIQAEDYDMGANGIATSDAEWQKTIWNCGSSCYNGDWNRGWQYRNDGVDIEQNCGTNCFNIYNVNNNDFLLYTINIPATGLYDITMNYAISGSTTVNFSLDGSALGTLNCSGSGWGSGSYTNSTLSNVNLPSGVHILRISFTGAINFNQLNIINKFSLPVALLSFQCLKEQNNNILIKWETSSELNTNFFEIEKSLDSKKFNGIGIKPAKGNSSSTNQYTFLDTNTSTSNYYRIKTVDLDGSVSYSEIIFIDIPKKNQPLEVNIYPNPIERGQDLTIQFSNTTEKNNTSISFIDNVGRTIIEFHNCNSNIILNTGSFKPGVNYLKISNENETEILKIVVL